MAFSSKIRSHYNIRSISLPSRSHPSTDKIDMELNKLKSFEVSSSPSFLPNAVAIIRGLLRLDDIYASLGDFLNLRTTQQALSHHHLSERHLDDIQDKFISLLDICAAASDFVSQMKQFCRDSQSFLRRRRRTGDLSSSEAVVAKYDLCRKNMKKDLMKLITASKEIDNGLASIPVSGLNDHVYSIIRALREVVTMTTSIFQSFILLVRAPFWKPKTRWSLVSKLVHNEKVTCEKHIEKLNEWRILGIAFNQPSKCDSSELGDDHMMKGAQERVISLVGDVENGLNSMYKGLLKTRSHLLNIGSSL